MVHLIVRIGIQLQKIENKINQLFGRGLFGVQQITQRTSDQKEPTNNHNGYATMDVGHNYGTYKISKMSK